MKEKAQAKQLGKRELMYTITIRTSTEFQEKFIEEALIAFYSGLKAFMSGGKQWSKCDVNLVKFDDNDGGKK